MYAEVSAISSKGMRDVVVAATHALGWRTETCCDKLQQRFSEGAAAGKDGKDKGLAALAPVISRLSGKAVVHVVSSTSEVLERLPLLGPNCWVSRYVGLANLCDKGNLGRMIKVCEELCGDVADFSFSPQTWMIPRELESVREMLVKNRKKLRQTYIVKPEDGSQGNGIFLVQTIADLEWRLFQKPKKAAVVQTYLDKPLLMDGMKFDLRLYVCLIGGSNHQAPKTFLCREGLARFCTQTYEAPTRENIQKSLSHLTNYSLNKKSENFEHGGGTIEASFDPNNRASKRPLTVALKQIQAETPEFNPETFYERALALVKTTVSLMVPALTSYYRAAGGGDGEIPCMQILGFDVMIDRNFDLFLLEVNSSPSLSLDEAVPVESPPPPEAEGGTCPVVGSPVAASGGWQLDGSIIRRHRERRGQVCFCSDMDVPHIHQTSCVDLAVKVAAVGGILRLLDEMRDAPEVEPKAEGYIAVDVTNDRLYGFLQSAERLFARMGGVPKAFSSMALRKAFGTLCQTADRRFQKHELDSVSLRCRASQFVARDRAVKREPLRLFDFLRTLRQVADLAFPDDLPTDGIERVIAAGEAELCRQAH